MKGIINVGGSDNRDDGLWQAAATGHVADVARLLREGGDPNVTDQRTQKSALHKAVEGGYPEIVSQLIKAGANLNAVDEDGATPEQTAHRVGNGTVVKIFDEHKGHHWPETQKGFVIFVALWQIAMIILYITVTNYGPNADGKAAPATSTVTITYGDGTSTINVQELLNAINPVKTSFYAMVQDVHVMIFIGFGFLMTFLRRYAFGATGYTLLVAACVLQWYLLVSGFWVNVWSKNWVKVPIDVNHLITSDFCAGAILISFGALIGKITPLQLVVMAIIETALYALNEQIGIHLGITDIGGSITIHMFGAYFGLSATVLLTSKESRTTPNNSSVYHSDTFAMVGTIFLWLFWPSFNGGTALSATQQERAIMNTVYSLTGSVMAAFVMSALTRPEKKFCMVDIQNATLAGGVAMGAAADMYLGGWAMLVGVIAGIVSVCGYVYITPLMSRIGLRVHDTCGIHNLHGMPSLIGAVVGWIFAGAATEATYGSDFPINFAYRSARGWSASKQVQQQVAYVFITLGISIVGGFVTGGILRLPFFRLSSSYDDSIMWETPSQETPYYFDNTTVKIAAADIELQEHRNGGANAHKSDANGRITNPLAGNNVNNISMEDV